MTDIDTKQSPDMPQDDPLNASHLNASHKEVGEITKSGSTAVVYSSHSRMNDKRGFVREALRDLRASRPTMLRFFERTIAQRYRFSSLGILWAFAPSVITAVVLWAGSINRIIAKGEIPPAFYGVFGLALGQTFLDGMNALRNLFTANLAVLRRDNVPLEGIIAGALLEVGFNTLVRILVVAISMLVFKVAPANTVLLSLIGFLGITLLGGSAGLLLAPFNALKRDIDNVMNFVPWVLFACTPVFVQVTKGSLVAQLYQLNPLSWIFDSTRALAYGGPGVQWPALISVPVGVVLLLFSWLFCRIWRVYVIERLLT